MRGNILEPIPPRLRLLARIGVLLIIGIWAGCAASLHTDKELGAWGRYSRNLPETAVRAISPGKLPRRLLSDYENSGYLHWRLNGFKPGTNEVPSRGRFPLFIDLLNAYPDWVMVEYLQMRNATPQGLKVLKKRRINCVVLGKNKIVKGKPVWDYGLARYLDGKNSGWKRVQGDQWSRIWVLSP